MWLGQPLHWAPSHAQTRPSGKLGIKSFPYESTQQRPRLTNRQTGDGTSAQSPNAPPHFFFFPCLPSLFFFFFPLLLLFIHPGTSCLLYFQGRHIIAKPSVLKPLWRHVSRCPVPSCVPDGFFKLRPAADAETPLRRLQRWRERCVGVSARPKRQKSKTGHAKPASKIKEVNSLDELHLAQFSSKIPIVLWRIKKGVAPEGILTQQQ